MGLDIRLPIGLFFALVGALLVGYGLWADPAVYAVSLGYNINLVWGAVLVVFGVLFLWLARRGTSAMQPAELVPEGQATEAREHMTGLESEQE